MSLIERFLGGSRSKAYTEGMNLLEKGHYAEAVDQLRVAALGKARSPTSSLASYHFRQALVAEGRPLMRAKRFNEARDPLAEAVKLWDLYPDLHCLHGTACGFAGDWDEALAEARIALRINPDYIEARLLEVLALVHLERGQEAANSLNALVESGRRVNHWLVNALEREEQYSAGDLPGDLDKLLLQGMSGRSEKEEVAAAVAMCRSGNWDEGLEKFAELVAKRPRYPDYRTRLAAALFQVGRLDEDLAEVEAALTLNDSYHTAIDLKGLILADQGRIRQAGEFLANSDVGIPAPGQATAHEELFGVYLRAVIALLGGDYEQVPGLFEGWPDLVRTFARAELLLAAADDLLGRTTTCGRRLADLVDEWSAEPLYFFLLACHHLENKRYRDVSRVLSRWPATDRPDFRPLFLESSLAVSRGRTVARPPDPPGEQGRDVPRQAWNFLAARVAFLAGDDTECWRICGELVQEGYASERVLRLQLAVAGKLPADEVGDWRPKGVLPESCLPGAVHQAVQLEARELLVDLLRQHTTAHPENLAGCWLSPGFWLDPIRGWIA